MKRVEGNKVKRDRGGVLIKTDVLGGPHRGIWGRLTEACASSAPPDSLTNLLGRDISCLFHLDLDITQAPLFNIYIFVTDDAQAC